MSFYMSPVFCSLSRKKIRTGSTKKVEMKKALFAGIFAASFAAVSLPTAYAVEEAATPKEQKDKMSYALGVRYGTGMKKDFADDLDFDWVFSGMRTAIEGGDVKLSEQEIGQLLAEFQQQRVSQMEQEQKMKSDVNKKDGDVFLAENKKKEGVETLASGLQYKVIKEGEGAKPSASDKVKVHYHGTFIGGDVFDSSIDRGEPITFPVKGVIKGWTEALQLMKIGSKWQLFIPPELGYGDRGTPNGPIGPNQTLLFEVELLGVES